MMEWQMPNLITKGLCEKRIFQTISTAFQYKVPGQKHKLFHKYHQVAFPRAMG
jgi:hypothetical protein